MGAKKISVVDLSQEEEQVKTSRKRAKNLTALKSTEKKQEAKPNMITGENNEESKKQLIKEEKVSKAAQRKSENGSAKKVRSNRYKTLVEKIDKNRLYTIGEAVQLAKETANTKFVGSIEVHFQLNQKNLRGTVTLPHGTGNKKTVLVFGDIPEQSGVLIGNEQAIEKIEKNALIPGKDFQIVIASPQYMPKIARVAKILGPKGLMPNPKSGTVSTNLGETLNKFLAGQIEYKSEANAPLVHSIIGKTKFEDDQLVENFQALFNAIGSNKIIAISVNSTMGPGIKVVTK